MLVVAVCVQVAPLLRGAGRRGLQDAALALRERLVGFLAGALEGLVQLLAHAVVVRAVQGPLIPEPPAQQRPLAATGLPAARRCRPAGHRKAPVHSADGGVERERGGRCRQPQGQAADDVLVVGEEELRHGAGDLLDGRGKELARLLPARDAVGDGLREPVQRAAFALYGADDDLYGQQHRHRKVVEHVVDRGPREGALQVEPVPGLAHGDDGVGHGGADVRAHDDGDACFHRYLIRPHQAHHDGGARGG
mmetsp:Transcript_45511/g.131837  ORF Transcript_45511/g.131837 Transcript_45511/m.131837 type:complete len:250 (+) Transcript_45511:977-1726(+)